MLQFAALRVVQRPALRRGLHAGGAAAALKADARVLQQRLHEPGRAHPAGHGMPLRGRVRGQARGAQLRSIGHRAERIARRRWGGSGARSARAPQVALQHAGQCMVGAGMGAGQRLQQVRGAARAGARQLRGQRVAGGIVWREQARGQAGGAGRRRFAGIQHQHLPAAFGQLARHAGAGQACAQHRAMPWLGGRPLVLPGLRTQPGCPGRRIAGFQPVALGRHARHALHAEAALREAVTHGARDGPGGQPRAGAAAARHGLERVQAPDVRVARRAETVQEHAVGLAHEFAQQRRRLADGQREQHAALVQPQPVHAGAQAPVLRGQFIGQWLQPREGLPRAAQVLGRCGMGLDRDEVQPRRSVRVGAPGRPGGQEVQAQAEAGLQDGPVRPPGPGLR